MSACLQMSKIPYGNGIRTELTIDSSVVFRDEAGFLRVCASIPYTRGLSTACIKVYNVKSTLLNMKGCVKFYIDIFGHELVTLQVPLGCFNFPLGTSNIMLLTKWGKNQMYVLPNDIL